MNDYGKNIREARKKAGLTQKELADASGVAKITIQQYEAGKRQPRLEQLMKIAEAMKIRVDVLMGVKPLPAEKEIYFKGAEDEHTVFIESPVLEGCSSFSFLSELGYHIFLDQKGILDNREAKEFKEFLYDYREDEFYIVEFEALERVKENILAYAKFQMNELLKGNKAIKDEKMVSELRSWGMVPALYVGLDDKQ